MFYCSKYLSSEQDDLWKHLTQAARRDSVLPTNLTVKQIMETWTSQPGFPVLSVINKTTNSVIVTQVNTLYLYVRMITISLSFKSPFQLEKDSTDSRRWVIPITVSGQEEIIWMQKNDFQKPISINSSNPIFLLNRKMAGKSNFFPKLFDVSKCIFHQVTIE